MGTKLQHCCPGDPQGRPESTCPWGSIWGSWVVAGRAAVPAHGPAAPTFIFFPPRHPPPATVPEGGRGSASAWPWPRLPSRAGWRGGAPGAHASLPGASQVCVVARGAQGTCTQHLQMTRALSRGARIQSLPDCWSPMFPDSATCSRTPTPPEPQHHAHPSQAGLRV